MTKMIGTRMSRMINPVIVAGLVNNSRHHTFQLSQSSFRFRYLNIPDNGQNVLPEDKFPHPLTCFLAVP